MDKQVSDMRTAATSMLEARDKIVETCKRLSERPSKLRGFEEMALTRDLEAITDKVMSAIDSLETSGQECNVARRELNEATERLKAKEKRHEDEWQERPDQLDSAENSYLKGKADLDQKTTAVITAQTQCSATQQKVSDLQTKLSRDRQSFDLESGALKLKLQQREAESVSKDTRQVEKQAKLDSQEAKLNAKKKIFEQDKRDYEKKLQKLQEDQKTHDNGLKEDERARKEKDKTYSERLTTLAVKEKAYDDRLAEALKKEEDYNKRLTALAKDEEVYETKRTLLQNDLKEQKTLADWYKETQDQRHEKSESIRKEAEAVLKEAEMEAEKILSKAKNEAKKIRNEVEKEKGLAKQDRKGSEEDRATWSTRRTRLLTELQEKIASAAAIEERSASHGDRRSAHNRKRAPLQGVPQTGTGTSSMEKGTDIPSKRKSTSPQPYGARSAKRLPLGQLDGPSGPS